MQCSGVNTITTTSKYLMMVRCDEHGLAVAGTKMRSEGDSGFYKSAALCTKQWLVCTILSVQLQSIGSYKFLCTNVVQIGPSVPTPWAGWAPPYVAIGTIRAPRYPRYPLVKESSEILKISTRDKDFIDINMCTYIESNIKVLCSDSCLYNISVSKNFQQIIWNILKM